MARPLKERQSDAGISGITAPASINFNQPRYIGSGIGPAQAINYNQPKYIGSGVGPAQVAPEQYGNPAYNGGTVPAPTQATPQTFAPPAPPPPPAPPVGGRSWYNGLDQGARAAQDQSWLGGDSDYTAQKAEYDKALQTFIDRIASQKKGFEQDANDATASTDRNQGLTLNQLGEDFGARGLSYSGLAVDSADKTNTRFNEAKGQIGKVLARNNQDADNRQKDYESENAISQQNAQKSSLARQAQRQALLDSMAGF